MQFISSLLSLALNLRIMCITSLPQNPNSLYQGVGGKDLEKEGGKDSSRPLLDALDGKKKSENQRGKDPLPHRSTFTIYPQTNSRKMRV